VKLRRNACARQPWGLRRQLRRHEGESGVFVHGWFPRLRYAGRSTWMALGVWIDGSERGVIDQLGNRLLWVPLPPGRHEVELRSGGRWKRDWFCPVLELDDSTIILLAFRPPGGLLLRRGQPVVWCEPRRLR
jgi:hypothetical protein